jgi:uncharacterized membrane protein YbhN (UPF0104 family)
MNLRNIVTYFLFVALGAILIYASWSKLNINELGKLLSTGNYIIAFPVFVVSVLGYIFRILRWQLMLQSCNEVVPAKTLFASLCLAYGVNFVVPRLGEVTRCLMLKKKHKVAFDKSLLTVVAERLLDTLCLFFLLITILLVMSVFVKQFLLEHILLPISHSFTGYGYYLIMALLLIVLVLAIIYYLNKRIISHISYYISILKGVRKSTASIRFWIYTIMIWVCYFFMTYLWFYTFDVTKVLTLSDAFLLMVIGSIGRSVPVQGGGLGAYHYLVANAALLVGLSITEGNALAIVIHGIQSIFTIFLGILSYIWFITQK